MNGEPSRYRKIPVVVEAMQYGPYTAPSLGLCFFLDGTGAYAIADGIIIPTLEGHMLARPGDWIIKGIEGEFYPCKPDIFAKTYEPATGKEVMPDEANDPRHTQSDTAPAGLSAGGGAEPTAVQPDALHRSFPEAGDGRPFPPMMNELMTAGLVAEDARFVAIQLARNGYSLAKITHVTETPKSEHDVRVMLTPDREVALREALAVVIDELRSGPCELEARLFLQSAVGVEILALIDRAAHD